ncbi:hypothetical protein PAMC26510_25315 [Caballeronia sordidicola]|jgi:hypothetical protein|uniref:Uncharacterized protein n=1 Tax=Caballeronia sordidicola TaxID=196367 RepID=A0A242MGX2_CABSO|nr:hypothetical protein PAMC26510_25315 [Caballeronia sordidicola]
MGPGTPATGCSSANVALFAALQYRKFRGFHQDKVPDGKRAKNVSSK